MLRKFLREAYYTMGYAVRIFIFAVECNWALLVVWTVLMLVILGLAFAAFLALRPAAKSGVALRGPGFLSGRCAATFAPHLGGKFSAARNPFVTAIRASHARNLFA